MGLCGPQRREQWAVSENGLRWQVANHEDRLKALEGANILVLVDRVERLSAQVTWMIVAFGGMILTTLGGIIVYLVTQGPVA